MFEKIFNSNFIQYLNRRRLLNIKYQLKKYDINIIDNEGNLRPTYDILEDLSKKWEGFK